MPQHFSPAVAIASAAGSYHQVYGTRSFRRGRPSRINSVWAFAALVAASVTDRSTFFSRPYRLGLGPRVALKATPDRGIKQSSVRYPGLDDRTALRAFAIALAQSLSRGEQLPWTEAQRLVLDATELLEREKTLEHVALPPSGHINVVGDVHGQFFDLISIFEQNGLPEPSNPYLFNGDFVDRGSFSVETLLLLLAWKAAVPADVHLARGNHESHEMNVPYGFAGEVLSKYSVDAYIMFQELFGQLPLAHVIDNAVLVVHGGLPRRPGTQLPEIEEMNRREPGGKAELFTDLLWADPREHQGYRRSSRGDGIVTFGPDVTDNFLTSNKLQLLIRSHEVKDDGYEFQHAGRCLTVFSAPQYCDSCDNKGAVIRLTVPKSGPVQTVVRKFDAAPKPDFYVPSMAYSLYGGPSKLLTFEAKRILKQWMNGG